MHAKKTRISRRPKFSRKDRSCAHSSLLDIQIRSYSRDSCFFALIRGEKGFCRKPQKPLAANARENANFAKGQIQSRGLVLRASFIYSTFELVLIRVIRTLRVDSRQKRFSPRAAKAFSREYTRKKREFSRKTKFNPGDWSSAHPSFTRRSNWILIRVIRTLRVASRRKGFVGPLVVS